MSKLEELEEAKMVALRAKYDMEGKRRKRRSELEQLMWNQIQEESGEEYKRILAEYEKADSAWQAEIDRVALERAGGLLPYPEGTVMAYWKDSGGWHSKQHKTSRRGVIQVYRQGDQHVTKMPPAVGIIIVRELKKDGTPSKIVYEWNYTKRYWAPESEEVRA